MASLYPKDLEIKANAREKQGEVYHTCCICKKKVYTGMSDMKNWAYKQGAKFCCSYSCMSKLLGVKRRFK